MTYPDQGATYQKVLKSLQESEFTTVEQVGLIKCDTFLEMMRALLMASGQDDTVEQK